MPRTAARPRAPRRSRRGASGLRARDELLQLARLEHLAHDIAAADELALHVELRDGRPVGVSLYALAYAHVLEHVDVFEIDAKVPEDLRDLHRETALRHGLSAFHEQHHVVPGDLLADPVLNILCAHRSIPFLRLLRSYGVAVLSASACRTPPMLPLSAS